MKLNEVTPLLKHCYKQRDLLKKLTKKGKHRRKRPRKSLAGMMLHLDGSPHEWTPALPGQFLDLLVLMDDATQ